MTYRSLVAVVFYFLGIVVNVVFPGDVAAFQFSPISSSMSPKEKGEFIIANDSDAPIAVSLTVKKRKMLENGEDVLSDADDALLIYPPQAIILPRNSRKVQVQWLGDKALSQEEAFRVIAEQLPVNLDRKLQQDGAQVQVLLRYVASLYVRPEGAKSHLEVRQVSRVAHAKGPVLRITIANTGNRQTLVQEPELTVAGIKLEKKDLGPLVGSNILSQSTRVFEIPVPAKLSNFSSSSQAELTYRESY